MQILKVVLAILAAVSAIFDIRQAEAANVAIIGGAYGPTAIFVTSRYDTTAAAVIVGIALLAAAIFLYLKHRH